VDHLAHAEDVLVVLHPLVHVAELDVADDVVDPEQAGVAAGDVARRIAGEERAAVAAAIDEGVQRLAVGRDRGEPDRAVLVAELVRLGHAARAAGGRLAVGVVDVGDAQRDHLHALAVAGDVPADLVIRDQRAGEHDPDPPLLEHVRGTIAHAGLQPGVGDLLETEGPRPVGGRLQRVADVELDVVDAVERHEVFGLGGSDGRLRGHSFMIRRCSPVLNGDPLRLLR
jgi:hypothetical protein